MFLRLLGGVAVGCATAQAMDYSSSQGSHSSITDSFRSTVTFAASPDFMKEAGKKKLFNAKEENLEKIQKQEALLDPSANAELDDFESRRDRRRSRNEQTTKKVEALAKKEGIELESVYLKKRQAEADARDAAEKEKQRQQQSVTTEATKIDPKGELSGLSWRDRKKALTQTDKEKAKVVAEGEDIVPDDGDDVPSVNPVQLVIIGGGLAAGRMAALMDSIVDVTIIDTKNFAQFNPDVVPLFAQPWSESSEETFNKCMYLHRYYLKRSKVMTAKAVRVNPSDQVVHLNDGRCVPYDALVFATGSRRAFPFSTSSRTKNQRKTELQHFNTFLGKCKRVAVVGGGPMGVSTAGQLAASRPDLEVVLYHSHPALLSALPLSCRHFTNVAFKKNPNLKVELSTRVTDVHRVRTIKNTLNGTMNQVPIADSANFQDFPLYDPTLTPAPAGQQEQANDAANVDTSEVDEVPAPNKSQQQGNWFSKLFGGDKKKEETPTIEGVAKVSLTPWEEEELKNKQQWDDQFIKERDDAKAVDKKRAASQTRLEQGAIVGVEDQYVLDLERLEGGNIITRSILYQWYFRSRSDKMTQGNPVSEETTAPFDYVFTCTGGTPHHQPLVDDELVSSHLHANGKFKASKAFQLMGQPHIFALGAAANMPWEASYIHAIMNVRFLFFQLYQCWTRAAAQEKASTINCQSSNVLAYNSTPRFSINLGKGLYTGADDAGNPCSGVTGFSNYHAQRSELLDALLKPKRFKANPPGKVRAMFDQWRKQETTDVSDFEFPKASN